MLLLTDTSPVACRAARNLGWTARNLAWTARNLGWAARNRSAAEVRSDEWEVSDGELVCSTPETQGYSEPEPVH